MQWFPPGLFSLHSLKIIFLLHKKVAFSLGLLSFQFFCLLNFFLPLCSGIFLNYNAEHLDTGFESLQPGQAVIHGPAPFMAVSFPALLLQPNILSASTESVSPHSLLSLAAAVLPLALQRRGDSCAWAWKRALTTHLPGKGALASSLELCGEGALLGNRKRAWLSSVPLVHNSTSRQL